MKKSLEKIALDDGRYSPGAMRFVYEALSYTLRELAEQPGHISGETLCLGIKKLAQDKWGRLAMVVLNSWGIKSTRDFGEIVYTLIDNKWLSAQPADSIDDFEGVYDFKEVFKDRFEF